MATQLVPVFGHLERELESRPSLMESEADDGEPVMKVGFTSKEVEWLMAALEQNGKDLKKEGIARKNKEATESHEGC